MAKFILNGTKYDLIQSKMTFAEARAFEKVTGVKFQEFMQDQSLMGSLDVVQALLWISMKRVEPSLKFSDLDDLTFDDIEWGQGDEDEEPAAEERPTEGEAAPVSPISA